MGAPLVNNNNFSQVALLTSALGTVFGVIVSQAVNWVLKGREHKTDERKAKSDEIEVLAGAGNELIASLLTERTALLNQLLAERRFYEEKITHVEQLFDSRNSRLEDRIGQLERENLAKDKTILEQQAQINDQKSQIDAQGRLIKVLQSSHEETTPTVH